MRNFRDLPANEQHRIVEILEQIVIIVKRVDPAGALLKSCTKDEVFGIMKWIFAEAEARVDVLSRF